MTTTSLYASSPTDQRAATTPLIFIVDDSALIRKLVTVTLQRAQFQVRSFADGVELLRALHEPDPLMPDLILLDIGLPKMNGFQVAHALHTSPRTRHCPLVIVSRRNGLLDHLRARLLGACAWLDKPFTTHSLLAVVRASIRVGQTTRLPRADHDPQPPLSRLERQD